MRRNRGLSVIEILIIVVCVGVIAIFFTNYMEPRRGGHEAPRKVRCQSNLSQIGKAMNMYLLKYGDNSMYALPAQSFRGDCWLAELYWSGIIKEPKVFLCPATDDDNSPGTAFALPYPRPSSGLDTAGAIRSDAISYAGLCKGLTGLLAHRNTKAFTEATIGSSSALACDDNEDKRGIMNHNDGMNVVYFDCHVEFKPGAKADTCDLIGTKGSEFEYLDSGE